MRNPVRSLVCVLGLVLTTTSAQASSLTLERTRGAGTVLRSGESAPLGPGVVLVEKDLLRTGAEGRMTLRLGARGSIELGANSELMLDVLPFAADGDGLVALRLRRGFMRLVWQPALGDGPLQIRQSGHHVQPSAGEFFFEAAAPTLTSSTTCVVTGLIEGSDELGLAYQLSPDHCYRFNNQHPRQQRYRVTDWASLRDNAQMVLPTTAPATPELAAETETPQQRRPRYEIQSAPATPVPAASAPADESLFTTKDPDLGAMLAEDVPAQKKKTPAAAKPVATVTAKGEWKLNVASTPSESQARALADRLNSAGHPAVVEKAEIKSRVWYRVRVTGYDSFAAARAAAPEIEKKFGFSNTWAAKN